jgi:uncharacterized damage-inducible protein DinB
MLRPKTDHYAPYYANYINLVPDGDLLSLLEIEHQKTQAILQALDESAGDFRYAEGKWSIKELLLHMLDTEQIMSYRALRIARGDKTEMPGFEQDDYVAVVDASPLSLADLAADWQALRTHTLRLLSRFAEEVWDATGTASNAPFSVRALAFIILGHELHHRRILEERYLAAL